MTVLDVNDNAPQFVSPSRFFVPDGALLGTIVGSVKAVDPDLDQNGLLQYRALPWSHPEGIFMVNPILGYLQVISTPLLSVQFHFLLLNLFDVLKSFHCINL